MLNIYAYCRIRNMALPCRVLNICMSCRIRNGVASYTILYPNKRCRICNAHDWIGPFGIDAFCRIRDSVLFRAMAWRTLLQKVLGCMYYILIYIQSVTWKLLFVDNCIVYMANSVNNNKHSAALYSRPPCTIVAVSWLMARPYKEQTSELYVVAIWLMVSRYTGQTNQLYEVTIRIIVCSYTGQTRKLYVVAIWLMVRTYKRQTRELHVAIAWLIVRSY